MKRILFAICLFIFIQNSSNAQVIRYVREGASGDGSAWQFASGDVQGMINASAPGDEVWVGEGMYKPTSWLNDPFNLNNNPVGRKSSFIMRAGVKLYGGFPATGSPDMNDRNPAVFESVLSGDMGEENSIEDNSYHVCFFPGVDDFVFDGFTVTGGNANGTTFTDYIVTVNAINADVQNFKGGGLFIYGGSGQVRNCRISGNLSEYEGAGAYIFSSDLQMSNNTFEYNEARAYGGAVYCKESILSFSENVFLANKVRSGIIYPYPMPHPGYYGSGGAVAGFSCDIDFVSNRFELNEAMANINTNNANGGAIFLSNGDHTITDNDFFANSSTYLPTGVQVCYGGAISIEQGAALIARNEFVDNLTHGSGGALSLLLGTYEITSNRFSNNEAIGNGGAMLCSSTSTIATNNIFDENRTGSHGGAIHCNYGSTPSFFVNNTFYANSTTGSQGAAGVSFDSTIGHVLNSIFYQNTLNGSTTAYGSDISFYSSGQSTFLHNLYQSGSSSGGNIGYDGDNNPLFIDAENGNFALSPGSPCIDAGSNAHYLSSYASTDYNGNNRIYNSTIDMGAIENQGTITAIELINGNRDEVTIALYPNPAGVSDAVCLLAGQETNIRVFDAKGAVCAEQHIRKGVNLLDLSLQSGIYFITTAEGDSVKLVVL